MKHDAKHLPQTFSSPRWSRSLPTRVARMWRACFNDTTTKLRALYVKAGSGASQTPPFFLRLSIGFHTFSFGISLLADLLRNLSHLSFSRSSCLASRGWLVVVVTLGG